MQTLSVVGVERGSIVTVTPDGERYRLPIDAALLARLQAEPAPPDEKRMSPREIQAHVRAGMSSEQVATLAGVSVAAIERFVGPVLAERSYVVDTALSVRLPPETEGARARTFGAVMGDRLAALAATSIRWSSAKEPSGWVLAASFIADDVQHDARWRFDAKRMQLDPDNLEAATLSQRGTPAALTPRLRAIEPTAPITIIPTAAPATPSRVTTDAADVGRFDSAAFRLPDLDRRAGQPDAGQDDAGHRAAGHHDREAPPAASTGEPAAARRGPTTEQLATLSRRRGEREPVAGAPTPGARPIDVVEGDADPFEDVFAARPVHERSMPAPVTRGRFGSHAETPEHPDAGTPASAETASRFRPRVVPRTDPARSDAARDAPTSPGSMPSSTSATTAPPPTARRAPASQAPSAPSRSVPTGSAAAEPPAPTSAPNPTGELRRPRARRAERSDEDANVTETLPPLDDTSPQTRGGQTVRPRRGRTSMPSWDEIVFGRDEH